LVSVAKYSHLLSEGEYRHEVVSLLPPVPEGDNFFREEGLAVFHPDSPAVLSGYLRSADLVVVHWWNSPEIDAFLRGELPPMRLMIWMHVAGDAAPHVITDALVNVADFAIAGSPYTYEQPAFQNLPPDVRHQKTGMVYDAADFSRIGELTPRSHSGFNVGYIGTVHFSKMHPRFVPMSASIRVPQLKIMVCGGGIEAQLKAEAASIGAVERFDFLGYVNDIKPVLEVLDVYGYPLCEDNYAAAELNLQEVMYAGIPPVVFPYGGVKRLVINDFTGLMVQSEAEYQEAIEYLYHHPEERSRLGENARLYASQIFGAENAAPKMNRYYERMLQLPKRERWWGEIVGLPLLEQPVSLADLEQPQEFSGSDAFIDSLGHRGGDFHTSKYGADFRRLLEADGRIAASKPVLVSAGGGIQHYLDYYPQDPHLNFWMALVRITEERYRDARIHLLSCLALGLQNWRVYWHLSRAARSLGDPFTALAAVKIALALEPLLPEGEEMLEKLAHTCSEVSFEDSPFGEEAQIQRLVQLGNFQAALNALAGFTLRFPLQQSAYETWLDLLLEVMDYEGAEQVLSRAFAYCSQESGLLHRMGLLRHAKGDLSGSEESLRRALALDPRNLDLLISLGDLNIQLGRFEEGNSLFQEAVVVSPDEVEAHLGIAICARELHDEATRLAALEKVARLQPDHPMLAELLTP
jgi:glycosyltransferase involved in cell wall biosynthesis